MRGPPVISCRCCCSASAKKPRPGHQGALVSCILPGIRHASCRACGMQQPPLPSTAATNFACVSQMTPQERSCCSGDDRIALSLSMNSCGCDAPREKGAVSMVCSSVPRPADQIRMHPSRPPCGGVVPSNVLLEKLQSGSACVSLASAALPHHTNAACSPQRLADVHQRT